MISFRALNTLKTSLLHIRRSLTSTSVNNQPPGNLVKVQDFNIHYEKVGIGDHYVLLFPSAMGSTRTDFAPQLEKLNHKKFTIIAWDPPGQGYSRPPDRTYPIDFFNRDADVARLLINKLGISKLSAVGWSDGGMIAMIFAAKNQDLVQKLVVFGANAFVTAEDIKLYEAVRDISKWSSRMRTPLVNVYGEEYFRTKWGEWIDGMKAIYEKKQGDICKNETREIACPTLIIHGKKDPMVPQLHPDFLKENIRNNRYLEYDDGKHNLHLRFQDRFNTDLKEFLLH